MSTELLTVLIPTYERARYVERLLNYLAKAGLRCRVVVADDSTEGVNVLKEAVARANDHFKCEYRQFPRLPWYRKCYETLVSVETPLVVLLADDDFLVPATLERAANRLAAEPDIALAHGEAMCIALEHQPGKDPMATLRSRSRRHLIAEQESPVERVTHYLRNYSSVFYSVSRREQLVANFRHMAELNQDYDFGQTMCGCLCLASGRAVAVKGVYYVVMDTAVGMSRRPSNLMVGWRRLITQPDFSRRYSQFKEIVLDALEETGPRREAEEALDAAFVDFVVDRMVNKRVGEFERLSRNVKAAAESIGRLGAVAQRGIRTLAKRPGTLRELQYPRTAMAGWARALDPMSIEALRESDQADAIERIIAALEEYPG